MSIVCTVIQQFFGLTYLYVSEEVDKNTRTKYCISSNYINVCAYKVMNVHE
jgi:hypothetical protein